MVASVYKVKGSCIIWRMKKIVLRWLLHNPDKWLITTKNMRIDGMV